MDEFINYMRKSGNNMSIEDANIIIDHSFVRTNLGYGSSGGVNMYINYICNPLIQAGTVLTRCIIIS